MAKQVTSLGNRLAELGMVAIASVLISGLVLSVRQLGWLQPLELGAYDRFVQLRLVILPQIWPQMFPQPQKDPRILVVGITEADIQALGGNLQLSDGLYADLFAQLLRYQPRGIGLDIYRDKPFGSPAEQAAFAQQLKSDPRIIGITKLGDDNNPTIAPPPALPPQQVGFNDVVVDSGGIVRRNLMMQQGQQGTLLSFSFQLALLYLSQGQDKIEPSNSPTDPHRIDWGKATFLPLNSKDGGYVEADNQGYQILLNYRGDERSFEQVSLGDIRQGKVAADLIQNRIILIGNVAESGKDFFYTPFSSMARDNQRMSGVVVHAQQVSQLLDAATGQRPLFWFWSEWEEILWIVCWSLAGGIVAWSIRHPVLLAIAATVLLLGLMGISFLFFLDSGWIPLVPPLFCVLITGATITAYTAQQASQQQRMVMRLLGQNTSPEIAETLWQQRDQLLKNGKLPGQRLIATLLFTDLRGFSSISERLPPEEILIWLNEYLEEITQVVQSHQGVINKFTGDGIMAAFGVPIPRQTEQAIADDAQRAVACALAMGDRLEQLNVYWQKKGLPQVQMRAGLFTGSVVVGSLGSKTRLEYGIIGDSVNTASRLESVDKHRQPTPCRVLIAQETLDYLHDKYEVEPWGPLELKGKETKILVYRVVGPRSATVQTALEQSSNGSDENGSLERPS
uniref:Adenylate/guanylate cyclase with Chase sensor n=1 Tax=Cyanothece sp. (strain PCC 7425 / ATCC 29141) TaxID=395961 RepID=B8HTJ3_CYAP4